MSSDRLNIYILNTNNFRFVQIHPRVIRTVKTTPPGSLPSSSGDVFIYSTSART